MQTQSENKTIVITGTASGFGRLVVQMFAEAKWNVVATVRKDADLDIFASLENVTTLKLDVNDEAADLAFGELARQQYGRVDALINNAGYFQAGPLESTTMDQVHRQFQTNVFGLIALNKAFIPIFREQRAGVIINVSSISAEEGFPYASVYEASKAAVLSLTEGMNAELSDFGIVVKVLLPGNMNTNIFNKTERAADTVADYIEPWEKFNAMNTVRSNPQLTADVMFRMVTDGNDKQVRYYSGPDGEAVPRVKHLLGQQWFWEEFNMRNHGKATPLWESLMPQPQADDGDTNSDE
ncbi:SDR family oxidoreductase [Lacticaseibacillus saniviri]